MKKIFITLFITLGVFSISLFTGKIYSQSTKQACVDEAKKNLVGAASALVESGFNLDNSDPVVGLLSEGETGGFETQLVAGNTYAFVIAGGCAADVDAALFDENENLIDKDTTSEPFAVLEVTPKWTGKFYVIIRMHETNYDPAVVFSVLGWQ